MQEITTTTVQALLNYNAKFHPHLSLKKQYAFTTWMYENTFCFVVRGLYKVGDNGVYHILPICNGEPKLKKPNE